jgi:hypothetical protein
MTAFIEVADLPRKTATEVKTQWGSVVREIHETGAIAVTSHDHIEVVVLAVERYRELTGLAGAPCQAGLDFLAGRFQARLERMKAGTIQAGAAAFMDDDGDFSSMERPPLVGTF